MASVCDMTSMGESHVLLMACHDIARGEKLYYDYNGYEHADPTNHFL
jgi:hypothetical protein